MQSLCEERRTGMDEELEREVRSRFRDTINQILLDESQADVANRLNISQSNISGYRNARQTPSLDVIIKVSRFIGQPAWSYLAYLLGEDLLASPGPSIEGQIRSLSLARKLEILQWLSVEIQESIFRSE